MWLRVRLVTRTFKKQTLGHKVVFLVVTIDSHGAFPLKSVKGYQRILSETFRNAERG